MHSLSYEPHQEWLIPTRPFPINIQVTEYFVPHLQTHRQNLVDTKRSW